MSDARLDRSELQREAGLAPILVRHATAVPNSRRPRYASVSMIALMITCDIPPLNRGMYPRATTSAKNTANPKALQRKVLSDVMVSLQKSQEGRARHWQCRVEVQTR